MAPPLLLLLTGLLYVLLFGGLSLLRREGLSIRFALEAVAITAIAAGLAYATGVGLNAILFLVILYLVTMRVRWLIDLGNALARGGHRAAADRVYRLALGLWPDEAGRLGVEINQGVLSLQNGQLDQAIATFKRALAAKGTFLGLKHECACHYNLGIAYRRQGQPAQAAKEFNAVLETWPASEYSRYAQRELERAQDREQV